MQRVEQRSEFSGDLFELSRHMRVYLALNLILVVGLCSAVVTASKIVTVGPLTFACCNIVFSMLTFPVTDIISEVFGIRYAKLTVLLGALCQVLFMLVVQGSIYVPGAAVWMGEEAYNSVLGIGPRVVFASLVAFTISSFWDVTVYAKFKRWNKGRFLWIRNNLSTSTAQILNAILFMNILFYGKGLPVWEMVLGSLGLRFILAAIDTPLVYMGVAWIHRYLRGETLAYTREE